MASKKSTGTDPKGYVEALREVEGIIQEIDSNNVDIDILAAKIKRAAFLISWCNERIDATEVVVEEIVADIRPAEFDDDSDSLEDEDEDDDDDFDDEE